MLERFHVPNDKAIFIKPGDIKKVVYEIFLKLGLSTEHAENISDVLTYADRRGIDSHGVSNMLRMYVKSFMESKKNDSKNGLNVDPKWKVVRDFGAISTIDGDGGLGCAIAPYAMKEAINKAKKFGVGSVTLFNSGHFGAAAYYANMAVEENMIGLATTGGGVGVVPTFSSEKLVGLNPLAFGVPTKDNPPFIFDASMSSVAGNKIELAKRLGVDVMPGWISDKDGVPIMQDSQIPSYDNPNDKPGILPLGGTREIGSHKGFGLAVILEILCGGLSNNGLGPFRKKFTAHHFTVYNIEAFGDLDEFMSDVDQYLSKTKNSKPAPGFDAVMYAGLPENNEEKERSLNGIPYHPEVIEWFRSITSELSVDFNF